MRITFKDVLMKRKLCTICFLILIVRFFIFVIWEGESYKASLANLKVISQEQDITIEGNVYQKKRGKNGLILYVKNNSYIRGIQSFPISKLIIYGASEESKVSIGDRLMLEGKLKLYENAPNPGNFDQRTYYAKDGIYGFLYADKVEILNHTKKVPEQFREILYQFREQWINRLSQYVGVEYTGLLSAMMLGSSGEMEADMKELYQKNGMGHLFAISGWHISFIGLAGYELLRRLGFSYGISGGFGICFIGIYALLVGMGLSVMRALCMMALKIGADICGREYDMPTAFAVAATIILCKSPRYLFDAGFLLSFGAVLGILIWMKILPGEEKVWLSGIRVSMAVQLMLLPVLVYFYYEIPLYSVLLNAFVIPLAGVILWSGFVGSITMLFGVWQPLYLCSICFELYERICVWTIRLPFARIIIGRPEIWQICAYYMILTAVYCFLSQKRYKKAIGCAVIAVFLLTFRYEDSLRIRMLNVGQGDCILIQSPDGSNYLVDGGSSDVKEVAKYRIESALLSEGVGTLHKVLLSHADMDHINGVEEMLRRQAVGVHIKEIVVEKHSIDNAEIKQLLELAESQKIKISVIEEGSSWGEELKFTCLGPGKELKGLESNETSMILRMEYGNFSMLFTGDMEGVSEEMLCDSKVLESCTVLKAAHHGSKNSCLDEFLAQARPVYTWISAGKDNRYGHPHQEFLERLKEHGSSYDCTYGEKALYLEVKKKKGKTVIKEME